MVAFEAGFGGRLHAHLHVIIVVCGLLNFVGGTCPNLCNQNGDCDAEAVCTCYKGYAGPDCSNSAFIAAFLDATILSAYTMLVFAGECPLGAAWAAKGDSTNAHDLVECSNAGVCAYSSGQCKCFPGFAGPACNVGTCACVRERLLSELLKSAHGIAVIALQ